MQGRFYCQFRFLDGLPLVAIIKTYPIFKEIAFDFYEINALNKLLGSIKTEIDLDSDEVNSFATSPYIISDFQKIHTEYMEMLRQKDSISSPKEQDFLLSENSTFCYVKERVKVLDSNTKDYIKSLTKEERDEYSDKLFAPFIPTDKIMRDLLETLDVIAKEKNNGK